MVDFKLHSEFPSMVEFIYYSELSTVGRFYFYSEPSIIGDFALVILIMNNGRLHSVMGRGCKLVYWALTVIWLQLHTVAF
jgi:hypothetical protein